MIDPDTRPAVAPPTAEAAGASVTAAVPRQQILVNETPQQARVAVLEDGRLAELSIECTRDRGIAGSIYIGRVSRVLPGMQAAFVDVGLPRAVFLHASDSDPCRAGAAGLTPASDPISTNTPGTCMADGINAETGTPVPSPLIQERFHKGDTVVVQIVKEPIGSKGSRVTCELSIPGRYVVYLPFGTHVGISRRIIDENERERLRTVVEESSLKSGGVIVRTAAAEVTDEEIRSDILYLCRTWAQIRRRMEALPVPSLLHTDLDIVLRTVRDRAGTTLSRVLVDNRRTYGRVLDFVTNAMPETAPEVALYTDTDPLFDTFGIERQIRRALNRQVLLPSGGSIVIDQAEALTAIDVNTGRYVGSTNQDDTILKTNLEAAVEIVRQLRLRNLGGLIVIDFIDMDRLEDRDLVLDSLRQALRQDRAYTTVLGISEFGLVEMTRKRTRQSLTQQLCDPCPSCGGAGRVKAIATTAYEVLRRVRVEAARNHPLAAIAVTLHPSVADFLAAEEPAAVRELEHELDLRLVVRVSAARAPDDYEVTATAVAPPAGAPDVPSSSTAGGGG